MVGVGARVPDDVHVWTAPGEEPRQLNDALGEGRVLLAFYLLDWSFT